MPLSAVVVEDDEMLRELLETALDGVCKVTSFADAESAWRHVFSEQPDLVVSDIEMPGMGGIVLLQRVKERFPLIKCVMLSGNSQNEKKANNSGADAFLQKPFQLAQLLGVVSGPQPGPSC